MAIVGEKAPDFNALDQNRERFILSKAVTKGMVLLVFYPEDDTPVCTSQLSDYGAHNEEFKNLKVQIFGISISTTESQKKFIESLKLPFPLINDYDSRITKKYGVMSFTGHPKRALFLIDSNQIILYQHVEPFAILKRTSEELLEIIDQLIPKPVPVDPETAKSEAINP